MILEYKLPRPSKMTLKDLKSLVKQGEGQQMEFKLKTNHPEKIIREVVAFANADGGKLLIGVSDNKEVKGLKFADEDEYVLQKYITRHIYPAIEYEIERIRTEGEKEVLLFEIKSGTSKPYYVDLGGTPETRKAYVRAADKSVQASREIREILKGRRKSKNIRFQFGDKEKQLMEYIENNGYITVSEFAEVAKIPKRIASRTLILLVLGNVLKVQAHEEEDVFTQV
jgi:predicted HTH transcriptional regulator